MSFFGKKTKNEVENEVGKSLLIPTNGEIDGMTMALIKNANDPNEKVRDSVKESLVEIGRKQTNLLLSSCHDFLRSPKPAKEHRVILLQIMLSVSNMRRDEINPELAKGIISLCMDDMLKEKEVIPDWQQAASDNLISIGQRFPDEVVEVLFAQFTPGSVPHYFVIKTLGQLFYTNCKEIFSNNIHFSSHFSQPILKKNSPCLCSKTQIYSCTLPSCLVFYQEGKHAVGFRHSNRTVL